MLNLYFLPNFNIYLQRYESRGSVCVSSLRMHSLTKCNSSLQCVEFNSLQCAYIWYSGLKSASNRPRNATLRCNAILQLVAKPYARLRTITSALRRLATDKNSLRHRCENLFRPRLFEIVWQVRLLMNANAFMRTQQTL